MSGGILVRWWRRTGLAFQLLGWFAVELAIANLEQARLVLAWPLRVEPRWIRFETRLQSATSRTLLGAMISLTPGTLTCDLQHRVLWIHVLDARSDEEALAPIQERFEALLLRLEETR